MTPEQIKTIQKTGIDWYGNPLAIDGNAGPKTKWWIGITSLSPLRQEVIRVELGYHAIGAKEEPSIENGGTFVDMVLKPAGLSRLPWCVALVSFSLRKAGVPLPVYYTSAWQIIEAARKNKWLVDEPIAGDVEAFLYERHPRDTRISGHGRLVLGYDKATGITAGVDGNVNNAVRCGRRHPRPERYFVRIPGLGPVGDVSLLTMPSGMMNLDNLADR